MKNFLHYKPEEESWFSKFIHRISRPEIAPSGGVDSVETKEGYSTSPEKSNKWEKREKTNLQKETKKALWIRQICAR